MMSDAEAPLGYAAAVDAYRQAGWIGVLPLKRGAKGGRNSGLPVGYTGHVGIDPSYADCLTWAQSFTDGNLCLRLPDGVIGIDIDAYGAKTGAAALEQAVRQWGPLPPTVRSTSREGNLTAGIRLFRVPAGTILKTAIGFPELGIGDIEICQRHHRYVVSWPSIHPEGRSYWWRNDEGQLHGIPEIDQLPELPATWIDGLKIESQTALDSKAILYDVRNSLTSGEPSRAVAERLRQAIKELNLTGASRHDTCTRHVLAIARLGRNGEPGVMYALTTLRGVFAGLRRADGSDAEEDPEKEFGRMLTNDNLSRLLAVPDITAWPMEILKEISLLENQTPALSANPSERTPEGTKISAEAVNDRCDIQPKSPLEEIERGFWASRESLAMIYQTALAQMASPWATLGICAARALTQVRPNTTLPALIGSPGSLNWFVALVARSGGGKGAASGAANLLIPRASFKQRTIGSGEGLVKLFDRSKIADPDADVNEAVLVNVDEVDMLTALTQRSASTTVSVLKQAFMGESLGFTYVNRANVRDIEDHGYRMTLVVSVQPEKSGGLFADSGGGLPQRFMWFPAGEKRVDMQRRWPSGALALPAPREWLYPRQLSVPAEAEFLIRQTRMKNAHEELDALDGHALFSREKFAYALTVLDGRVEMNIEDWELSGIAADVSIMTRQGCIDELYAAGRRDAVERGALRGIEMESADVEKLQAQVKRGQRVMKWILHKLDDAPDGYLTQTELLQKITGRDRKTLGEILVSGNQLLRGVLVDGAVRWSRA